MVNRLEAMRGTWLFLRTRFTITIMLSGVASVIVTRTLIMAVAEISVDPSRPPRYVNMLELVPFAFALICVLGCAPRFIEWERLGGKSYRVHLAGTSLACVAFPQIVLYAGVPSLPPDTSPDAWRWIPGNLLAWSAIALLMAALLGHLLGVVAATSLFALVLVIQNKFGPVVGWLPLASGWDPKPRWAIAIALAILALVVYPMRSDSPSLESRWRRNEA